MTGPEVSPGAEPPTTSGPAGPKVARMPAHLRWHEAVAGRPPSPAVPVFPGDRRALHRIGAVERARTEPGAVA